MLNWFFSSSLLLAATLALRALFHRRLDPRWTYALWLPAALRLLCGGQGFFKGAVMGRGSIHRQRSQSVHGLLGDDLDVGQGSYLRCRDLRAGVPPVDKGITVR